jgi:ketosteroid isomerase-like protein
MLLSTTAGAMCTVDGPAQTIAETFNIQWAAAVRQGDRTAVESLYVEEALLMPPTDETLYGPTSISDYLIENVGTDEWADYSIDLVSCEVRGNTLHLAGVWGARQTDGNGASDYVGGNLVRVLKQRANGTWASSYDIWN